MLTISALKIGDIIYPVAIKDKTLYVMARLPIEKIEPAYDHLIRKTGSYYSTLIPEGILIQEKGIYEGFNKFKNECGYTGKIELPNNIHTIVHEEKLVIKPHKFHQAPISCCTGIAVSGNNGSSIKASLITLEKL